MRQRDILRGDSDVLLVAGDGVLIDESGAEIGGRLRDRFPPPLDWGELGPAERVRAAIRRPFVTGATCGLRRELVPMMAPVPRRWLFDRWATLVATARDGLVLQPEAVIRYRIHPGQLLGDRQANGPARHPALAADPRSWCQSRRGGRASRATSSVASGRWRWIAAFGTSCHGEHWQGLPWSEPTRRLRERRHDGGCRPDPKVTIAA